MPVAQANGINLYYELTGLGSPVTLISGVGYGGWVWYKQVPVLSEMFMVLTFDNRGVGRSDKPEEPYNVQLFAADTVGLWDALGIEKTHLVGTSLGGMIAQQIALDHPERVDRLVLASTTHGGLNITMPKPEVIQFMTERTGTPEERFQKGFEFTFSPGFLETGRGDLEYIQQKLHDPRQPDEAYQRQIMSPLGFNAEPRLDEITHPTLVISGEEDQAVPVENSRRLAEKLPNAELVVIPNAGHLCFIEAADAFNSALMGFLGGGGGA